MSLLERGQCQGPISPSNGSFIPLACAAAIVFNVELRPLAKKSESYWAPSSLHGSVPLASTTAVTVINASVRPLASMISGGAARTFQSKCRTIQPLSNSN